MSEFSPSSPSFSGGSESETAPLLVLIDGHSLAFRAYYAFATSRKGPLKTSTGIPTSICFGFLNSLTQVVESQQPQFVAVAFDRGEPTFRHEADANYKADRKETPEDFVPDLNNLKELLAALNLPVITAPGYEADDVLGTLAQKASLAGYRVKILTGDRDLFQLVDQNNIKVLYLSNSALKNRSSEGYIEMDPIAVEEKLGIKPHQVVDYKALCGDKSDNIPGVRGIGDKTAVKLLQEYGDLATIYQNLDNIGGAVQKKLETGKADALHSQYLAQIHLDTPVDVVLEECKLQGFDSEALKPILEELELKTFLKRIDRLQEKFGGTSAPVEDSANISGKEPLPSATSNPDGQLALFAAGSDSSSEQPESAEQTVVYSSSVAPKIIDTSEQLTELVELLKTHTDKNHPVAWDTETTSLNPRDAELVGIGCCWGATDVAYIPTAHTQGHQLAKEQVLSALRPILEDENYPKAFQNAKFDRVILWHQGIRLAGVVFDTMLASYVLRPEQSHKLEDLAEEYLSGIRSLSYKELKIPKGKTIADLEIQKVADYCGLDAYVTFCLVSVLNAELKQPELRKLLLEVEQPLEPVLAAMEDRGVCIDTEYLHRLSQQLEQDLQRLEAQAYQYAGEEFNLGSPKQLGEILFEKLGLDRSKSRKTKTGYSTDHATLEKLQHDHAIVSTVLEHRTLSKLKSTYVDALPALVRSDTGRVHTNFNQSVTTTGRLSSSDPNLQNIPIRTEFSRKIRQAFIPKPGWQLVAVDYSQIELRILAHLTQQPVLLEAYRTGSDVHGVTAKLIFDKESVTSQERRLGKIINFGVIYGMGAQRFAREAGVSAKEGKAFIEKYRSRYAEVFAYLEKMKREAIAHGYVTTILGRRRYFNFASKNLMKLRGCNPDALNLSQIKMNYGDAQLLRAAANAPIQGSSADIIKIAMVKLHSILQNYQAQLLLQVHDELVFEVPPDEWEGLQPQIVSTMENAVELSVPLVVDVRVGQNWMDAQ
ncbi:MAG: DNA polymerase I [Cyanophyceae cyanobacterium]